MCGNKLGLLFLCILQSFLCLEANPWGGGVLFRQRILFASNYLFFFLFFSYLLHWKRIKNFIWETVLVYTSCHGNPLSTQMFSIYPPLISVCNGLAHSLLGTIAGKWWGVLGRVNEPSWGSLVSIVVRMSTLSISVSFPQLRPPRKAQQREER